MSGETRESVSGWTIDTALSHLQAADAQVYVYFERILLEHATAHKAEHVATDLTVRTAFEASQAVNDKTEKSINERFHSVNEFRGALDDVTRRLELALKDTLSVAEFQRYLARLETERAADARQRAGLHVGVFLAIFGAVVSLLLSLIR